MRWRTLKRGLCRRVGKGRSHPPVRHAHRNLVPGRGPRRPEEQDHAALGQARHAAVGTQGSEDEIGLHLWRDLPGTRQGSRSGPAILQHPDHVAPPGRDIARHRARRCASFSTERFSGALPSSSPSGPRALNRTTQSRTICNPTLADAGLVLEPYHHRRAAREGGFDLCQRGGKAPFLKSSIAYSFWAWWRGRAVSLT